MFARGQYECSGGHVQALVGDKLRAFIVSNYLFGDRARLPADEESLIEGGVIDSTGILELIEFLEETFDIEVAESETVPENLGSVAGIVRFVSGKLSARALGQPATS